MTRFRHDAAVHPKDLCSIGVCDHAACSVSTVAGVPVLPDLTVGMASQCGNADFMLTGAAVAFERVGADTWDTAAMLHTYDCAVIPLDEGD